MSEQQETFIAHRGRPDTKVTVKLGMTKEGKLTACHLQATQEGGGYAGYGIITILYTGRHYYAGVARRSLGLGPSTAAPVDLTGPWRLPR